MTIKNTGEYYGQKGDEVKLDGLVISEYNYVVQSTDWHYHEHPYFMFLLNGKLKDHNKKRTLNCTPGTLLFHNWQEPHYNTKCSVEARGFHCEISRTILADEMDTLNPKEGSLELRHPDFHILMAKIYYEFHNRNKHSDVAIEILVTKLCNLLNSNALSKPNRNPSWLSRLLDLLNDDDQPHTLKGLADQLGVHPVHLCRSLPNHLIYNLGEYLRRKAIMKSLPMIINHDIRLTEVSMTAGFADQSHFTRTFKQIIGLTPSAYRKGIIAKA